MLLSQLRLRHHPYHLQALLTTPLVLQADPFVNKIIRGVKIGGTVSEMFWFRAVAMSYIMRLNGRTLQVLPDTTRSGMSDCVPVLHALEHLMQTEHC